MIIQAGYTKHTQRLFNMKRTITIAIFKLQELNIRYLTIPNILDKSDNESSIRGITLKGYSKIIAVTTPSIFIRCLHFGNGIRPWKEKWTYAPV